jgi:hypothetical protein
MTLIAAGAAPLQRSLPLAFASLKEVYAALAAGTIAEADAERLDAALRTPPRQPRSTRPVGRFHKPPRQRSPDRQKSLDRRRTLAATWALPPSMACKLTVSEQAYARLLVNDHHAQGFSAMSHDEAAARVGCSRETIKRASHALRRLGWIELTHRPVRGRKHQTNIVRITSPEWRQWVEHGPAPRPDPWKVPRLPLTGEHLRPSTKNHFYTGDAVASQHQAFIPDIARPTTSSGKAWPKAVFIVR